MMLDLARFTLGDLVECAAAVRGVVPKEPTMQGAAQAVVRFLYDSFGGETDRAQLPLVRLYKTHPLSTLPADARAFAQSAGAGTLEPDTRCLALLATVGVEEAWNDTAMSQDHRAIPLPGTATIEQSPMIAALVRQLGLDPDQLVAPTPEIMVHAEQHTFNVFHVEDAASSEYVPAKGFVERYGISSVLGFGGVLPPGDLFATILFSRVPIPRDVAELFAPVALSVKLTLLPFVGERVFS